MTKRTLVVSGILLAMTSVAVAQQPSPRESLSTTPPIAKTDAERKILAVLDHMVKEHQTYLNVPMEDGKALWLLASAADAKQVAEIGTSTGYSGLWFCLALHKTGGHLTTFELDHHRATMAREHFQQAGVENLVTIVEGDAHQNVAKLKGPIDVAFIDADKEGYLDYLNKILPLVRPGGLILAHNVDMVADYCKAVTSNPDLDTIFYMEGNGLAVSLKKR